MSDAPTPNAAGGGRCMLFVGPLAHGTTTLQRLRAMRQLGFRTDTVDTRPEWLARRMLTLGWRLKRRIVGYRDEAGSNHRLLGLPARPAPDLVWVEKGLAIEPSTLRALRERWPEARFISFSPDDMFNRLNQSPQWLAGIGLYHVHVTTKSFNVPELRAAGAPDVALMDKGYSPEVHRPLPVTSEEVARFGGDVGFVGWPERERARSMTHLARNGIPVRVWGPWLRWWPHHPRLRIEGRPLWADDYARAICALRINLCFLRKVNRDRHTTRSIEIPACGGFMLAERTEEHQRLFEEDREAVFFSSDAELLDKVRYYLEHEDERIRIAAAGLARCRDGHYDHVARLAEVLRAISLRHDPGRGEEEHNLRGTLEHGSPGPRSQNCSTIEPYSGVR